MHDVIENMPISRLRQILESNTQILKSPTKPFVDRLHAVVDIIDYVGALHNHSLTEENQQSHSPIEEPVFEIARNTLSDLNSVASEIAHIRSLSDDISQLNSALSLNCQFGGRQYQCIV